MCSTSQNHHARIPEKRSVRQLRDGRVPADGGERAQVPVTEWLRRLRPAMRARMLRAAQAPICLAAGATPGTGLPSCCRLARSPATNTSGCAGQRQVRLPRARVRRDRARRPSCLPSGEAATPAAQRMVRAAMRCPPNVEEAVADLGDRLRRCALRRRGARAARAPCRRGSSVKRAQHARPGLDQQHARLARIDVAEFVAPACGARSRPACRRARRRSGRRRSPRR